jgi:protein-arginine kinase activator protein McsA
MEKIKCENCGKEDNTVCVREIKENGVVGYYEVSVKWCDECAGRHNKHLLETWGGD